MEFIHALVFSISKCRDSNLHYLRLAHTLRTRNLNLACSKRAHGALRSTRRPLALCGREDANGQHQGGAMSTWEHLAVRVEREDAR
jgi:hypothetical protein